MPPTTDVLLLALALLTAFVFAARAYMAVNGLQQTARRARRAALAVEERTGMLAIQLAGARTTLGAVNGGVERGLWTLTRLDGSLDAAARSLADRRGFLDGLREQQLVAAGEFLRRVKAVGRLVVTALNLRRSLSV